MPAAAAPLREGVLDRFLLSWLIPLLLVVAGVAAYQNSFQGIFTLDDFGRIVINSRIRQFWPPWMAMAETSRPIVQLTLAFNYMLGGENTWGYHAFNLAVHLIAGLLLFGVVRRTLQTEDLRERYGRQARWLAAAAAGIWLVHPLLTQAVTYVIQRTESLMGMFLLLTLYCGIRACESARPLRWSVASILACALGMGCKEVMVVAPVLVWLHDRMFFSRTQAETFRKRWGLYYGLAATWLVLGAGLLANNPDKQTFLVAGLDRWGYAITQFEIIAHYLRLALWPGALTFDYAWPIASSLLSVAPSATVVLALLAGTCLALWRRHWTGFWGAWFFLILAPTSSIVPIADLAAEHRMYLPLAAVVVVVVVAGHDLLGFLFGRIPALASARRWLEGGVACAVIVALSLATVHRNDDYRSAVALWSDTVAKRPDNPRARASLGTSLSKEGKFAEATVQFNEAIRLKPDYADAHRLFATALVTEGRDVEAILHFTEALKREAGFSEPHNLLGAALLRQGRVDEAITSFDRALRLRPDFPQAHNNMGVALAGQGRIEAAIEHFAAAVRAKPDYADARENLKKAQADPRRARAAP